MNITHRNDEAIEKMVRYMDEREFITPSGIYWHKIYEMLPPMEGKTPSLPLILSGYHFSSDEEVRARFIDHLKWAEQTSVLDRVSRYFYHLKDDQFYKPRKKAHEQVFLR